MVRTMKDSGIEWIGEIPENWSILRNKNIFTCSKEVVGKAFESTQLLSLTTKGVKEKDINDTSGKVPESYETYQFVKPNQIVMCLFDLDCSAVFSGISKNYGMISPAYDILDCKENKAFSDYYSYWFLFVSENRKFKSYAKNLRYTLKYNEFSCLPVVVPPLPEQQKIAGFLDEKCGAIDEIISKTEQSIEEYKKLKQSVITKAVTKGIRPNRPMQDSNIEWIGEIPTDWETRKIFQLFTQVKNKNAGMVENNLLSLSYGKIIKKNIETSFGLLPESFETYNIIEKDDIVLRLTDLQNDHRSLRVGLCKERGIITSAYVTMRQKDNQYAPYLYYLLHTFDVKKGFYGMGDGVRQGLNWDELKHLSLVLPPPDEQKEITDYLDEKCAEIDTLVEKKQQFLAEMANYKKSLIYEYVTGKKEVA